MKYLLKYLALAFILGFIYLIGGNLIHLKFGLNINDELIWVIYVFIVSPIIILGVRKHTTYNALTSILFSLLLILSFCILHSILLVLFHFYILGGSK